MKNNEALVYLEGLEKFGSRFGLDREEKLLSGLGNPHRGLKCILVAGTNGKGSVCAFLGSILKEAGFKTGMYISPPLKRFNERISINGRTISDEDATRLIIKIKRIIKEKNIEITHFEFITAMAFEYFREKNVDFAVLEVGMGGRLDATNVANALVSVITRVELEHTEFLGKTIHEIAFEKAGIVKENGVLVTAESKKDALDVIEKKCDEKNSKLIQIGRDVKFKKIESGIREQIFDVDGFFRHYKNLKIKMLGDFQLTNATTALAVIEALNFYNFNVDEKAIRKGLLKTEWPGRMQIVGKKPFIVLDCAHNLDGIRALKSSLVKLFNHEKLILVIGISKDKDYGKMIREIGPVCDTVIATKSKSARALEPVKITEDARRYCSDIIIKRNVQSALEYAKSIAGKNDLICVTGSIFVVSEVL